MFDPQMELLLTVIAGVLDDSSQSWPELQAALKACGETEEKDEDLVLAIECEEADALREVRDAWISGQRHLFLHDREVLKRALKAFRKTLKVTLLDDESMLGGNAFSSGRESTICGIRPPERYGAPVWDELVRQKRLEAEGPGLYGLPPGG